MLKKTASNCFQACINAVRPPRSAAEHASTLLGVELLHGDLWCRDDHGHGGGLGICGARAEMGDRRWLVVSPYKAGGGLRRARGRRGCAGECAIDCRRNHQANPNRATPNRATWNVRGLGEDARWQRGHNCLRDGDSSGGTHLHAPTAPLGTPQVGTTHTRSVPAPAPALVQVRIQQAPYKNTLYTSKRDTMTTVGLGAPATRSRNNQWTVWWGSSLGSCTVLWMYRIAVSRLE